MKILITGGTRDGLMATNDAFQKSYNGHTKGALYQSANGGLELVILILDKTLKNVEYSTYGGGSRQFAMDPSVSYRCPISSNLNC